MNYKIKKLKDVADFIRGITYKPNELVDNFSNNSVVCMRTANIQTILEQRDLLSVPKELIKNSDKFLEEGDILVSTANSWNLVGKCCWVPKLSYPATAGGFISILRAKESINKRFLYYWFNSENIQRKARDCGRQTTNISNMDINRCLEIEISLPALPTQTKIAKILDKADQIRQKRKKAIELADEFLRSLFLEMFGDPVVNPKGWITKPIKEVINNFNEKDNYKDNDNIWLLNLDMIKSHTGEIIEKQFCQYKNLNNSTRYFDGSTILYNKLRPYLNKVVIPKENEHGYCTTELVALQPNTQFIDRYFLAYYLRSKEFLEWAEIKVAGAKMPRLNMNDFWMKDIYIPSLELQNKFAQIVKKTEFKKRKLQSQLKNMDELFNSLSQQYFTKAG